MTSSLNSSTSRMSSDTSPSEVAVDDPQKLGRLLAAGSVRLNLVLSQTAL